LQEDAHGEYGDYACYSLGWSYYQVKKPDKSVEYFDRLLKEYPDSSPEKLCCFNQKEIIISSEKL